MGREGIEQTHIDKLISSSLQLCKIFCNLLRCFGHYESDLDKSSLPEVKSS
jgi:hypothetical protein